MKTSKHISQTMACSVPSTRRHRVAPWLALIASAAIGATAAQAQISLTGTTYTQDFNTLAATGTTNAFSNNSTITGLYAGASATLPTTYVADAGTSVTAGLHSYGPATGATTNRALGAINTNATGTIYYGFAITNNTGATITSLKVQYTGEEWRYGGAAIPDPLTFDYRIDATFSSANVVATTGYTTDGALTFNTPVNSGSTTALDGTLAANQATLSDTLSLSLPVGSTIFLRFTDLNITGNDDGTAIDNFSVTVVPEPTTVLGAALVAGAFGWSQRRRLSGLSRLIRA